MQSSKHNTHPRPTKSAFFYRPHHTHVPSWLFYVALLAVRVRFTTERLAVFTRSPTHVVSNYSRSIARMDGESDTVRF